MKKAQKKQGTPPPRKKLRIAIVGLTSCDGCSVSAIDMGAEFIGAVDHFELGDFFLIMDEKNNEPYDVTFVEGAPLTKQNIANLKAARKRTKVLVSFGACACHGVIPNIKNHIDKERAVRYVYPQTHTKVFNPDIRPLKHFVKVDLELPGCPPDGRDIIAILNAVREGISPKLLENPVCYECQLNGNECVLQKGEPCLGPVTRGGCDAVCLNSKFFCKGCRGMIPGYSTKQLERQILENHTREELNSILQIFGIQEDWYEAQK
ncbi:MAG: hypothetical protein WC505_06415 [Patescibacteria group bacterium]